MSLAIRHRDDPSPALTPLAGLAVRRVDDPAFMAHLQNRTETEMAQRMAEGHRAYVAWCDGQPAAWGWVATRTATIGELSAAFFVPEGERYLWNFVTVAAFRGRGIYPRLLDAIVRAESVEAERFWIAYAPENHASAAGIHKAGFVTIAELSFDGAGRPAVHDLQGDGGVGAAAVLGLPESPVALAPCWRCARNGVFHTCAPGACTCDYQRPEHACEG
ncbi:MAG TPA: GNAT family N-acetyltransferase [Rhodothermales bacterium]